MTIMKKLIFILLCSLFFSAPLVAEEGAADVEEENTDPVSLPPGVLSSFGKVASVSTSGDVSLDEGAAPNVISASLQPSGSGSCSLTVRNSSDKSSYSLRMSVVGYSGKVPRKAGSKYVSMRVGPGKSVQKSITCRDDYGYQVVLRSGKRS